MAGSPCPVEVMKRVVAEMHMAEVSICYGMTETSPVSLQTRRDDDLERRTGTVGRVLPHMEVKVVDPARRHRAARTAGELCTRGYSVMLGYWEEPERTAEAIDAGRWMHTGDLAVDARGRLRRDRRPHQGHDHPWWGEHLSARDRGVPLRPPEDRRRPGRGRPDERYGEEVLACVIPRDPADPPTLEDLRAYCEGRLAHYKIPSRLRVLDAFPMTVAGKVRKIELREAYAGRRGRRRPIGPLRCPRPRSGPHGSPGPGRGPPPGLRVVGGPAGPRAGALG